jgi:hypothetical protein
MAGGKRTHRISTAAYTRRCMYGWWIDSLETDAAESVVVLEVWEECCSNVHHWRDIILASSERRIVFCLVWTPNASARERVAMEQAITPAIEPTTYRISIPSKHCEAVSCPVDGIKILSPNKTLRTTRRKWYWINTKASTERTNCSVLPTTTRRRQHRYPGRQQQYRNIKSQQDSV